jgi:hypothetical protein
VSAYKWREESMLQRSIQVDPGAGIPHRGHTGGGVDTQSGIVHRGSAGQAMTFSARRGKWRMQDSPLDVGFNISYAGHDRLFAVGGTVSPPRENHSQAATIRFIKCV